MRTWIKLSLGAVALIVAAMVVLGGTGAYFVLRHLEKASATAAESTRIMDAVRARFGARPPLVEIVDPRRGDIRINRPDGSAAARVETVHIDAWKAETGELIRTAVPLWLLRFSSVNLLSQLGLAPARFRLTVADIERYGPGIVLDHGSPGADRVLIWVD